MKAVAAIFDIGKTNKKLFLFDEDYHIVDEIVERFEETVDEDGFPCEDIHRLSLWVTDRFRELQTRQEYEIKAVNFSAYGASLVYIDQNAEPLTPLYNYLKPFPEYLADELYKKYGGKEAFSIETASPALGSLNSGLQLYRLKKEQPGVFQKMKYALHLPQYLSSLISGQYLNEITSMGCHTAMWDFQKHNYHQWLKQEGLETKLPPMVEAQSAFQVQQTAVGIGLHDSSAALIPYLVANQEPFLLLSTGTWCISLNPFDHSPLSSAELAQDCLCYLQYTGKPVKASRLFAGFEHEVQVKRIADHFNWQADELSRLKFDAALNEWLINKISLDVAPDDLTKGSGFEKRSLIEFSDPKAAYHQLIIDLVHQQYRSTRLVLKEKLLKELYVDGGFSNNDIYMHTLALKFPDLEVFAASVAQASALGAAMVIADRWNNKTVSPAVISLQRFT